MIVYLVVRTDWDGGAVLGVYSTEERAETAAYEAKQIESNKGYLIEVDDRIVDA